MNGVPWRTARRVMALSQGNSWYKIRNAASTREATQLHIYDEIGMLGVSASGLIDELAEISGPLDVHLNSPGGEVFEGLAIYNALLQRDDVTIYIDGMAASIASVIAMAGETVKIARSARMMVHDGFAFAIGNAKDMRALADQLDFESDNIAGIYAFHAGGKKEDWRAIMRQEKWYNAEMAIDSGLAHEIIETRGGVSGADRINAKQWDLSIYKNGQPQTQPQKVNSSTVTMNKTNTANPTIPTSPSNAASHGYSGDIDVHHEPVTGMHSHNHASFGNGDGDDGIHAHSHSHDSDATHEHAHTNHSHDHQHANPHKHAHELHVDSYGSYGPHGHDHAHHKGFEEHADPDHDGDDDSTAAGDTDHDYWAAPARNSLDAEQRAKIRGHLDLHAASYDDTNWDIDTILAEISKIASPASALETICAGVIAGDSNTEDVYVLPHHKHPGSAPSKTGVESALAQISSIKGLANRNAAMAHLLAHAAAWKTKATDGVTDPWADTTDDEIDIIIQALKGVRN